MTPDLSEFINFLKENHTCRGTGYSCMVIGKDVEEASDFRDFYLNFQVFCRKDDFRWGDIPTYLDYIIELPHWRDRRPQEFIDKVEDRLKEGIWVEF